MYSIKQILIFNLFILFLNANLLDQKAIYSKSEKDEEFIGKRKLDFQKRISAEERYENLLCSFIAAKKDQDLFKNDIFYIENGYYDYGFFFLFENKKCGVIDSSYWVFVYPKWYLWKDEA